MIVPSFPVHRGFATPSKKGFHTEDYLAQLARKTYDEHLPCEANSQNAETPQAIYDSNPYKYQGIK
jgi:hypothetical protein